MAVVVAALRLPDADVGQLSISGNKLVRIRAEYDLGLPAKMLFQQQLFPTFPKILKLLPS